MTCGVYKIGFEGTEKSYIGSSRNIDKRLKQHMAMLEADCHHSYKLQEYFNSAESSLTFEILEECEDELKFQREAFWVQKFNTITKGFNVAQVLTTNPSVYLGADSSFIGVPKEIRINLDLMFKYKLTPSQIFLLSYLIYAKDVCANSNLDFSESQEDIAKKLSLSYSSVRSYMRELAALNLIKIDKLKQHNRNTYEILV